MNLRPSRRLASGGIRVPRPGQKSSHAASYCTLPVTDALLVIVKVQLLALFPPLEQAPDQIASRPLLTLKVIEVLAAKFADPVLPTATLIPLGLDVRRSPLRPVAVTVSACA
jgi:hypothetical protein